MQLQVCPHCHAQFFNNGAPPSPCKQKKKALWSASGKPQEAHHSQNNSRELLFPWPSPDKIVVNSPSRIFCGLTILYGMDMVWSCSGCNLATFLPASLFPPLNQKKSFFFWWDLFCLSQSPRKSCHFFTRARDLQASHMSIFRWK